jgi:hypothetical protein
VRRFQYFPGQDRVAQFQESPPPLVRPGAGQHLLVPLEQGVVPPVGAGHAGLLGRGEGEPLGRLQRVRRPLFQSGDDIQGRPVAGDEVAVELGVHLADADLQLLSRPNARHVVPEQFGVGPLEVADRPRRPDGGQEQGGGKNQERCEEPRDHAVIHDSLPPHPVNIWTEGVFRKYPDPRLPGRRGLYIE